MVAAANNHLINVVMAVVRASASGVDGKTESIITVPRFLGISLQCMDLQIKHPPILVDSVRISYPKVSRNYFTIVFVCSTSESRTRSR